MARRRRQREKRERRIGPIRVVTHVYEDGSKDRRLLVRKHLLLGFNDKEKEHGPGKPERGRHIHIYIPLFKREIKIYLDGRRPLVKIVKSRALERRARKKREHRNQRDRGG